MNGLIRFTAAKEQDEFCLGTEGGRSQQGRESTISGEEARRFYQSLIEEEEQEGGAASESGRKKRRTAPGCERERGSSGRRRRRRSGEQPRPPGAAASERDGHRLLKCAQEGDLRGLGEALEKNRCDINFKDAYYWTAIMCASYAGRLDAVRLLLRKGAAWVGVVDTQGRDARDLADQAGHVEVVRELDGYGVRTDAPGTTSSVSASEPQWCSVCGAQYSESADRHESSTLHQFSLRRPPPTPQYCLPASSAGYRLMLREGWDPRAGLGPEGAGRKDPVRTVLKRDQGGLGYGPAPKARVTHFKARDARAVKRAPEDRAERRATLGRRAERRRETEDRNWERDFRTSFNL